MSIGYHKQIVYKGGRFLANALNDKTLGSIWGRVDKVTVLKSVEPSLDSEASRGGLRSASIQARKTGRCTCCCIVYDPVRI